MWRPVGSHTSTEFQKEKRLVISAKHLKHYEDNNRMLNRIISIDETYLKSYDPRDTQSAKSWCLPGQQPSHFQKFGILKCC